MRMLKFNCQFTVEVVTVITFKCHKVFQDTSGPARVELVLGSLFYFEKKMHHQ